MKKYNSSNNLAAGRRSLAGSARSTPRMTPSTSHSALPTISLDLPATAATSSGSSPPSVSSPQPSLLARENSPAEVVAVEGKKKKKEKDKKDKKEKKDKSGRPQNALMALACARNGGAAVSPNVVDLRCFGNSTTAVSTKRSIRAVTENVPATQILPFLYLGSVKDAQDPVFLATHNVRYIINVSQEEYWSVDKRVQIFTYKVDDSATADIASLFSPTRCLINNVRERYYRSEAAGKASPPAVLVHCQKGRSRSATIVLAYLIFMNGWSVAEAMKYVATRRPCVEPNIGFMEELRKLQESLSSADRTKRYSELCWFMRNLDPAYTTEAQVRATFEQRVGFVRDVVMLTAPSNGGSSSEASQDAKKPRADIAGAQTNAAQDEESRSPTKIISFSKDGDEEEEAAGGGTAADPQSVGGEDDGSAPRPLAPRPSPSSPLLATETCPGVASGAADSNKRVALCFVFLACREDILRGIKSGELREILEHLRPAVGKQIKYATGPKLRKVMTEHQSMSSSFVQDMAPFNDPLRQETDAANVSCNANNDDGGDAAA